MINIKTLSKELEPLNDNIWAQREHIVEVSAFLLIIFNNPA